MRKQSKYVLSLHHLSISYYDSACLKTILLPILPKGPMEVVQPMPHAGAAGQELHGGRDGLFNLASQSH